MKKHLIITLSALMILFSLFFFKGTANAASNSYRLKMSGGDHFCIWVTCNKKSIKVKGWADIYNSTNPKDSYTSRKINKTFKVAKKCKLVYWTYNYNGNPVKHTNNYIKNYNKNHKKVFSYKKQLSYPDMIIKNNKVVYIEEQIP